MRFLSVATLLFASSSIVSTASIPDTNALVPRNLDATVEFLDAREYIDLEKRKGGGGGGGGGKGGGGGSSSSSSGSSGSSGGSSTGSGSGSSSGSSGSSSGSSGSSGSSSSSGSRPASFSSGSSAGGQTRSGSGIPPAYGGGRYYAGGAAVPYTAGGRSRSGISPFLFPAAGLAFFPGLWLYGAYAYPFHTPYYWNHNTTEGRRNDSVPVDCLCQQYSVCGCDDNGNSTYVKQVVNNGTGDQPMNSSNVRFVTFDNGTSKAFINGTLPNGTTAAGGTDPSNASESSTSAAAKLLAEYSGYWVMVLTVLAAVMLQ